MNEDKLDQLLSKEAQRKGWAETKVKFAARILRYVLKEVEEKDMKTHIAIVIKYLESYEFDE